MASRLSKLCPRILLLSSIAVFIFLSGSTASEEPRRCYWCGPLAEQVHRSQRSPACRDYRLHQTVCDKGYTHCAIVVTAPPYAESRLCVKFYQDECYSLYCNSTNTWRMVCACRGDLCNGPHSDRETKAFATIAKAAKNNTRIKRALMSTFISVKTKSPSENNTVIIIHNKTNAGTINIVQGDQQVEEQIDHTSHKSLEKHVEDNIIIEHGSVVKNNDKTTHTPRKETNLDNNLISATSTEPATGKPHSIDDIQSDKQITSLEQASQQIQTSTTDNLMATVKASSEMDKVNAVTKPSTEEDKPNTAIEISVQHKVATDKMPPAEALQQNVSPTKAMEVATTVTEASTGTNGMTYPTTINYETNVTKKNSSTHNVCNSLLTIIIFLYNFFF